MKQGAAHDITAMKREPISKAASETAASQLGTAIAYKKAPLYEGRGYEAPKNKGETTHHCGSQGRH